MHFSRTLFCFLLLLLGMIAPCMSDVTTSSPVKDILMHNFRFTQEQVQTTLIQPIPEHARKEIEYGLVNEDFVRLMQGIAQVQDKLKITNKRYAQKANPWHKMWMRYICAQMAPSEFVDNIISMYPDVCLFLWPSFLAHGPEISYDFDFPLREGAEPWSNPTQEGLKFYRKYAEGVISNNDLPEFLRADAIALRTDVGKVLNILDELDEHPAEGFQAELTQIETQPTAGRRFARLICTRGFRDFEFIDTKWDRLCFAYWHRYMKMEGD